MFELENGRTHFYQWDTQQRLIINDNTVVEVHYCNRTDECSLVCEVYTEGGKRLADVPNILLQDYFDIRVYAYCGSYTKVEKRFEVVRRSKPADYVYTETEVKRYEELESRISNLEKGGGADLDLNDYYTKTEADAAMDGRLENYAAKIINTASAANLTIKDAEAGTAISLVSAITAKQTGNGNPSPTTNIRPIEGYTAATITNSTTGQSIAAELPYKVYGGSINWDTGILTVDTFGYEIGKHTAGFSYGTASNGNTYLQFNITGERRDASKTGICDRYRITTSLAIDDAIRLISGQQSVYVYDSRFTDKATAEAIIKQENPLLVMPLETVKTYQLTPQQMELAAGTNTIVSNTGAATITYRADTKQYVDNAAGVYELIETITVEENDISRIQRDAEPNGTKYRFEAVSIDFEAPAATKNAAIQVDAATVNNPTGRGVYINDGLKTTAIYYHVYIQPEYGFMTYKYTNPSTDIWSSLADWRCAPYANYNSREADTINLLSIYTSGVSIPIGTIIRIWGVRA